MKQIIVQVHEGLGNQLFQYALWLKLREAFPTCHVRLEDSRMRKGHRTLGLFRIVDPEPLMRVSWWAHRKAKYARLLRVRFLNRWGFHVRLIREEEVQGWEELCAQIEASGDCLLQGFWQWAEVHGPVIGPMSEAIQRRHPAGRLPTPQREWAQQAIAVHVRLDDYLLPQNQAIFQSLGSDYFARAIAHLTESGEQPELVIFSDAPDQVLDFHPFLADFPLRWARDYCADHIEEFLWLKDFQRVVISNSTFSYWASSIGSDEGSGKQRVFPRTYFHCEVRNAHYEAGKKFAITPGVTLL
jgi:hypothetical protein